MVAKVKVLVQQTGVSIRYWAVTETGCKPFASLKTIVKYSYEVLGNKFIGDFSEEEIRESGRNIVGELLVQCNQEES